MPFADTSGNAGVAVTAVTDGSSVTFDDTVPTITTVTSTTNDGSYKEDDTVNVTVTLTASETIGTPTVTLETGGLMRTTNNVTSY